MSEFGGAHDFDDIEGSPTDVKTKHLELLSGSRLAAGVNRMGHTYVIEFGDSIGLDTGILLPQLLFDLLYTLSDVLCL